MIPWDAPSDPVAEAFNALRFYVCSADFFERCCPTIELANEIAQAFRHWGHTCWVEVRP